MKTLSLVTLKVCVDFDGKELNVLSIKNIRV